MNRKRIAFVRAHTRMELQRRLRSKDPVTQKAAAIFIEVMDGEFIDAFATMNEEQRMTALQFQMEKHAQLIADLYNQRYPQI